MSAPFAKAIRTLCPTIYAALVCFCLSGGRVEASDLTVRGGEPLPATQGALGLCVRLLHYYRDSMSQRAVELEANQTIPSDKGFLGRILRFESKQQEREAKRAAARNGGRLPFEIALTQAPPYFLANIPPSQLTELEGAVSAENGEIRFSSIGGYFRQEGDRPILCLPPYALGTTAAQLSQHFYVWRNAKERLRREGKTKSQAIAAAFDWMASPQGVLISQLHSKSTEFARLLSDLTEMGPQSDGAVFVEVLMGTPPRIVQAPFETVFKPEDFITNNVYPFVEQLKRLARLREVAGKLRWKVTSLPSTRKAFFKQLDAQEQQTLNELANLAVQLHRRIVSEAPSREEALRLNRLSLLDTVLFTHDLKAELSREGKRLLSRIQAALDIAEIDETKNSKLTAAEQEQIENVLKRRGQWYTKDNWGREVTNPTLREFAHQGKSMSLEEFRQLDGEGFQLWEASKISGNRMNSYLLSPPTDIEEIRARQGAIQDLTDQKTLVFEGLHTAFHSSDFAEIRKLYFSPTEAYPNVCREYNNDWHRNAVRCYADILNESGVAQLKNYILYDLMKKWDRRQLLISIMDNIRLYFRHISQIRTALEKAPSRRLQQLKWVLDGCFDATHSLGIASRVRTVLKDPSYINKYEAFESLNRSNELHRVAEAYGEIALLFDFADHARTNNWPTFPHYLDPDPEFGPVLNIRDLHNPRVLHESPEKSVPVSVSLNEKDGRNLLITGPNGQGKSTVPRSVAAAIIFGQNGSPIPASFAEQTPLSLRFYLQPRDKPADAMSLLMMQGAEIMKQIIHPAARNRFTISFMDEILPGTIPEIREDAETEILLLLARLGGLSATATHNWGTTSLGTGVRTFPLSFTSIPSQDGYGAFQNVHVDHFQLLPGAATSLADMYEGAIAALRVAGWPEDVLERIRKRGEQRIKLQVSP